MTLRMPNAPSLAFLAILLLVLPWAAIRSASRVRGKDGTAKPALPPPEAVWLNTIVTLAILFAVSWFVARTFGCDVFALARPLGVRDWGLAVAALAACLVLRAIARATRPESERRELIVYKIAPRTPRQWALWLVAITAAGIAEESAYRGVGMQILWYALGNPWIAALLLALAFAVAHTVQGMRSMVFIVLIALVMHALVALTETLVLAMAVHSAYDLIAGILIARDAKRMGLHAEATT